MAGEDFDAHDIGYVPEDPNFFPQILSDEGTLIDDSEFPHLLQIDEHDAGILVEDANPPENLFHEHDDVGDFPGNTDHPPQDHMIEEHHVVGDVAVDFNSPQQQGSEDVSKGNEIKRWPGWPGENVFRMLVPVQKVGSIIGRKGEFIKKITEETKARIKILDGPPGIPERAVSPLSIPMLLIYVLRDDLPSIIVCLKHAMLI